MSRNSTMVQPERTCPRCGKKHRHYQIASTSEARRLCDECYKKYREECKEKGTYV